MSYQHNPARNGTEPWSGPYNIPPTTESMVLAAMERGHIYQKLARSYLQHQHNWGNWAKSKEQYLNSYHNQGMIGLPVKLLPQANVLSLLWTYVVKPDGTRKSLYVCNREIKQKGSVTLDHMYAAALDHSSAWTFWAISALHRHAVVGTNATNPFVEAPPPNALNWIESHTNPKA